MAIKMIMPEHQIQALILDAKKKIASDIIAKLNANTYTDNTGNLRSSIGYIEKDGKIVIYKGMDIIQIL